jgi:hypothetical protein
MINCERRRGQKSNLRELRIITRVVCNHASATDESAVDVVSYKKT